jgi:hypothetical protein
MAVAVRGPSKTRRVPLGAPAFFPVGEESVQECPSSILGSASGRPSHSTFYGRF